MQTLETKSTSETSDEHIVNNFIKDKVRIEMPNGEKELIFYFDAQELINKGFTYNTVESEFCIPLKEEIIAENDNLDITHLIEMDDDKRYLCVIFTVGYIK